MIKFFVAGMPATQGSKKAIYNPKANRAYVVEDCKRNGSWRSDVRNEAQKVWSGRPFQGMNIMGLSFLCMTCAKNGRALDSDRFANKIGRLSPNDIKRMAHQMPRLYSGLPYRNYAAAFLQEYIGRYQSGGTGNRNGGKIREGLPTIAEILNVTGE